MITYIEQLLASRFYHRLKIFQFILAITIFAVFALMPTRYVNDLPSSAPTLHFIGNFLLFSSAWVAWHGRMKLGILIFMVVAYSIVIELAQWLTPSRQVDPHDLVANMLGLLCGFIFAHLVERIWRILKREQAAI